VSVGARLDLKHPSGWFAAGREVECALGLLSDAAFRLFMWICLHADRSRGSVCVTVPDLALALGKTKPQIASALEELVRNGVCILYIDGVIAITDRFWRYQRVAEPAACPDSSLFVAEVKRSFLARRCVRSAFTAADERFALRLHRDGVSLVEVERAVLLGSLRKYATLINNGRGTPITALRYFAGLFAEVREQNAAEYWKYVAEKVRILERRWTGFNHPAIAAQETK
jgi:hypothetical protein